MPNLALQVQVGCYRGLVQQGIQDGHQASRRIGGLRLFLLTKTAPHGCHSHHRHRVEIGWVEDEKNLP